MLQFVQHSSALLHLMVIVSAVSVIMMLHSCCLHCMEHTIPLSELVHVQHLLPQTCIVALHRREKLLLCPC